MQHFCRRTQPRKFEYFKNNIIGDRFLDRKNKNYENFLTGENTKKYHDFYSKFYLRAYEGLPEKMLCPKMDKPPVSPPTTSKNPPIPLT